MWLVNILTPYILSYREEIIREKELGFIIRGNLAWIPEGSKIERDSYQLESQLLELNGKNINNIDHFKNYLQMYENTFEIWGIKKINFGTDQEEDNKIMYSVRELITLSNIISLLNDVSVQLLPARINKKKEQSYAPIDLARMPRSTEEMMHTRVKDNNIEYCIDLSILINNMPQSKFKKIIERSIYWHAQANNYLNSISRFTFHWKAIEIIADYFFKKETKDEYELLQKELKNLTQKNYEDIIFNCYNLIKTSVKEKIINMLGIIRNHEQLIGLLFEKDEEAKISPYALRNKIAHGGLSDYDFKTTQKLGKLFDNTQKASKSLLLELIINNQNYLNIQ